MIVAYLWATPFSRNSYSSCSTLFLIVFPDQTFLQIFPSRAIEALKKTFVFVRLPMTNNLFIILSRFHIQTWDAVINNYWFKFYNVNWEENKKFLTFYFFAKNILLKNDQYFSITIIFLKWSIISSITHPWLLIAKLWLSTNKKFLQHITLLQKAFNFLSVFL